MYNQEIVRQVIDGDIDAFSKMYNDCAPAVYRRAYSLLDDTTLSREAVRNVFRDIKRHIKELKNPEDFDEWVFRLTNAHVKRLENPSDKPWMEPELKSVWQELTEEIQFTDDLDTTVPEEKQQDAHEQKIEPAEANVVKEALPVIEESSIIKEAIPNSAGGEVVEKSDRETVDSVDLDGDSVDEAGDKVDEWQPILFPPEEEGGKGAASLQSISELNEEKLTVSGEDGMHELEPLESETGAQKEKSKKLRKVRYEAATVVHSDHFRVEQVPYDYIPYEESSQEAYDKVSLDETPRAVYEHIPYSRPSDFSEGGEITFEKIPFEAEDNKRDEKASFAASNATSSENEFGSLTPLIPFEEIKEKDISSSDETSDEPSSDKKMPVSELPAIDTDVIDVDMPDNWMNIDPLDIDVDEMLQEIVEEVNAEEADQKTAQIKALEVSAALDEIAVVSQPQGDEITQTNINITQKEPDMSIVADAEQMLVDEAASEQTLDPLPKAMLDETSDESSQENKPKAGTVDGQTVVVPDPKDDIGTVETEESDELMSAVDHGPRKKRSKLAGAGFFIGVVAIVALLIYLGYYMQFW